MTAVMAIFFLGSMITLLVAKGVLQAHEFTRSELEKQASAQPARSSLEPKLGTNGAAGRAGLDSFVR